ncbi:transketolase family protein [Brachybacterium hainanense]|uniref:Transketolase family protein n=1 Tax=Brachybacterium hainanense TaxID=1541174 RepID=A0ABV6RAQ0_9MICO
MTGADAPVRSPRAQFGRTVSALLDEREDLALVYAEISAQHVEEAAARHPRRVINVGIREQLLVGVGAGLALEGIRPLVHTFAPFLVERAFEQIKLDFAHQGVGGVLIGSGGSYDMSVLGRTHQSPGDVALAATVPGIRIHAPAGTAEADRIIREAAAGTGLEYVRISEQVSSAPRPHGSLPDGGLHVLHRGGGALSILALGHLREAALAAGDALDATVLSTTTVHPLDGRALRAHAGGEVVILEPWLEGTSLGAVADALSDAPRRFLAIGTSRQELRRYGTPAQHEAAHGLGAPEVIRRIRDWR